MGLEFLARVRRTTIWISALVALAVATYAAPLAGLAVVLGAGWSLGNLFLLERLIVAVTGPDRGQPHTARRAIVTIAFMLAWFGAGALLLGRLDPAVLLAGFLLPFAVLTFKAASLLMLGSRFWARLTASPWRATVAVVGLVVVAWWAAAGGISAANPNDPPAHGATQEAGATNPSDPHATGAAHDAGDAGHAAPGGHDAAAGAAEGGHAAGGHEAQGPSKFPNVITFLTALAPDTSWAHFLHHYEAVIFSLFVGLLLCLLAWAASRNPQMIPRGLQNGAELVVEKLYDFLVGILGEKHGPRYVPFLGTLFLYIFCLNLFGLVLFMDSPTSNLNVTFALGLTVFVYVQWIGIRNLGIRGYVDHLLGSPRNLTGWALAPLMLPIHVLGELAKPISLSCRLFGNIFGEDMLMVAFATLGIGMLAFAHLPFGLPLHAFFFPLALLTSALQALVFTVLTTIYFLLMLPHEEHGHEGEAHHAH